MISPVIFDLVKQEIKVGSKQIEAWWSVELEQDLAMMHGVFLRDSITSLCKIIKGQYSGMIGLATYHEISVTIENILIKEKTGLPVTVAEDPLTCVVRGSGKALEDLDLLRKVTVM